MKKETTFEQAMERLTQIVEQLESGEAPLDESMKLFEEGVKLAGLCGAKLDAAEQKIIKIAPMEDAGRGEPEAGE